MAEERRHDNVKLVVDGQSLAADLYPLITLVRVEESVQLPDSFAVRLDDPHFELFDRHLFRIGTRVEIGFRAESDPVTVTAGEVTAISVEQAGSGRHELVLHGFDVTHRLARGPKTRTYVQMTDADIAEKVAREYGFQTDIDPTGEVNEYVLQASQSDLAFLSERARRIGFDLWITAGTLHYKARPIAASQPPPLRWGDNLHKFKVRLASSERCDEVTVRGWDPLAARAIVGRATSGDAGTDAPAAADLADGARTAFGETARFAGQFPVASQAAADALAQSLLLRASGGEVVVKGEAAGDPRIAAGASVAIENVGQRLSGRYRITSVEHVYGTGSPYVTRFTCGGKDAATLADLVGGAAGTGRRGPSSWGSGLAVGVVTNCDDPERLGRVKVKFPTLTDDDESTWARLASPGAGPGRGLVCIPEVGDEVMVGFELGDAERPVVVGGLWNRQAQPPGAAVESGEVTGRYWRSRNGHMVALDDRGTGQAVVSHGEGEVVIRLERDRASLDGGETVDVEAAGEVTIEAGRKLVLRAPQIEIDGSAEVKVTGGMIRLN